MKVKTHTKVVAFEPVTIEITIETTEELLNLWHRTNISAAAIRDHYASMKNSPIGVGDASELWEILDELKKEHFLNTGLTRSDRN
jgi:hypothetical protein